MNIDILPNGNLHLSLEEDDDREEIADKRERHSVDAVLWDLMEPYWANGSFEPFSAEDGNPFVGLSSAPCIAEEMDVDDDGKKTIVGRFWAYTDYMLTDPIQVLLDKGEVVFEEVK